MPHTPKALADGCQKLVRKQRPIALIAESSAIGVGSDVRLVMVNYAVANGVGTINAGVNVRAPTTLDITPQTQAGLPWMGWAQLQKNGEGKNQKPARFVSREFSSDQTSVKHPQEERRELVDIAAEERGLRSLQGSKFYNKSPYLGHIRHLFLGKPRPDETKNGGLATPQFFSTVGSIPKWKPPSSS